MSTGRCGCDAPPQGVSLSRIGGLEIVRCRTLPRLRRAGGRPFPVRCWRACRLPGLFRLGGLARRRRRNADRPAGGPCRGGGGLGARPEMRPASRREARLVLDHAGRDAINVGDIGPAKVHRIAGAGLLLFGGIGGSRRRECRSRKRRCKHQPNRNFPVRTANPPMKIWSANTARARFCRNCG